MASPATMDVTRIAALASETLKLLDLVNPFTISGGRWKRKRESQRIARLAMPLTRFPRLPLRQRHLRPALPQPGRPVPEPPVTLRVGELEEGPESLDHEATWLLGPHPARSPSRAVGGRGRPVRGRRAPRSCRYLHQDGDSARCAAHGFTGPRHAAPAKPQPARSSAATASWWWRTGGTTVRRFPPPPRSLPVLDAVRNPCATAACRTADNTRKAACCRDLQVEIMCTRAQQRLEALVRSRRSPYLCKIERAGDYSLEVEMISACGYLDDDGVGCSLHGRHRPDGRTGQARSLLRMAPQEPGAASRLCLRPAGGSAPGVT